MGSCNSSMEYLINGNECQNLAKLFIEHDVEGHQRVEHWTNPCKRRIRTARSSWNPRPKLKLVMDLIENN